MKKFILTLMAAVITFGAFAAKISDESIKASQERIAKIQKLLEKEPKLCGVAEINDLQEAAKTAATMAILNSVNIITMDQEGATADGIAALGIATANEVKAVKDASEKIEPATKALKSIPPMKAMGAKKSLSFAQDCLQLLAEESTAQTQMVAELAK